MSARCLVRTEAYVLTLIYHALLSLTYLPIKSHTDNPPDGLAACTGAYIMNPSVSGGTESWSACSTQGMKNYLESDYYTNDCRF